MSSHKPVARQPKGTPIGGQFAEQVRDSAEFTLQNPDVEDLDVAAALSAAGVLESLAPSEAEPYSSLHTPYDLTTPWGDQYLLDIDFEGEAVLVRALDEAGEKVTYRSEDGYSTRGLGEAVRAAVEDHHRYRANAEGLGMALDLYGVKDRHEDFFFTRTKDGAPRSLSVDLSNSRMIATFDEEGRVARLASNASGAPVTDEQRAEFSQRVGARGVDAEVWMRSVGIAAAEGAKRVDAQRAPVPPTTADVEALSEMKGVFANGYTDDDITRELAKIKGAHLVCVWEYADEYGYGGDSEIVGRVAGGPWRPVSDELWEHLAEPDSDVDLNDISLLADRVHEADLPAVPAIWAGSNIALRDQEDDQDEDEGDDYDPDVAWKQLVDAGYDPGAAREVVDSAGSYESAYELIIQAEGR